MARKQSYKRRRRTYSKGVDLPGLIAGLIMFFIIGIHVYVRPYFEAHWNEVLQWLSFGAAILVSLLILLIALFFYKRYKRSNLTVKDGRDAIFSALIDEIQTFSPVRKHGSEAYYQMELAGYLKKTFPNLDIEEMRSDTRPDIVVGNIAIEIKGPTGKKELRTIADKIIRYLKHYDNLVVILFDLQVEEKEYLEWEGLISETFSNRSNSLEILVK